MPRVPILLAVMQQASFYVGLLARKDRLEFSLRANAQLAHGSGRSLSFELRGLGFGVQQRRSVELVGRRTVMNQLGNLQME